MQEMEGFQSVSFAFFSSLCSLADDRAPGRGSGMMSVGYPPDACPILS